MTPPPPPTPRRRRQLARLLLLHILIVIRRFSGSRVRADLTVVVWTRYASDPDKETKREGERYERIPVTGSRPFLKTRWLSQVRLILHYRYIEGWIDTFRDYFEHIVIAY